MNSAPAGGGGGVGYVSLAPFEQPSFSGDVLIRDCSSRICNIYCPQWCTYIFPPPPPEESGSRFPPLFIALIAVLAGALLLVCYYAFANKYCRGRPRRRRQVREWDSGPDPDGEDPDRDHPWLAPAAAPAGLDEAVVKSIAVHKYRKGDGSVEGTDCSVCLGEFREEESVRLLPKCNHAFHVACIDAWFKSHSNCPLCRSDLAAAAAPSVVCIPPSPILQPPPPPPPFRPQTSPLQAQIGGGYAAAAEEDLECGGRTHDEAPVVITNENANANANAAPRKRSGEGENEGKPRDHRVGNLLARSRSVNKSQRTIEVVMFSGASHGIHGSSVMGAGSSRQVDEDERTKGRSMGSEEEEEEEEEEETRRSVAAKRSITDEQHSKGGHCKQLVLRREHDSKFLHPLQDRMAVHSPNTYSYNNVKEQQLPTRLWRCSSPSSNLQGSIFLWQQQHLPMTCSPSNTSASLFLFFQ